MAVGSQATKSKTSSAPVQHSDVSIPEVAPPAKPQYNQAHKSSKKQDEAGKWVAKESGFRSNSPLKQGPSTAESVTVNAASTSYTRTSSPRRQRRNGYSSDEDWDSRGPRSFPWEVKEACWRKAEKIPGRSPDRWRMDPYGNMVFKKLVACEGCLCHNYDHIQPFSKGGASILENCQLLQAKANRVKSNRTDMSYSEISQKSAYCRFSKRDMDVVELAAYGNVVKTETPGGCFIS